MTTEDPMPEPEGLEDERFVYVMTAAGVEALRESAATLDSERAVLPEVGRQSHDAESLVRS